MNFQDGKIHIRFYLENALLKILPFLCGNQCSHYRPSCLIAYLRQTEQVDKLQGLIKKSEMYFVMFASMIFKDLFKIVVIFWRIYIQKKIGVIKIKRIDINNFCVHKFGQFINTTFQFTVGSRAFHK